MTCRVKLIGLCRDKTGRQPSLPASIEVSPSLDGLIHRAVCRSEGEGLNTCPHLIQTESGLCAVS